MNRLNFLLWMRSHRLIATCALPIGGTTLKYGSDNSGHNVHADVPELNALMEECGRRMYMKPHMAGNGQNYVRFISGPTGIVLVLRFVLFSFVLLFCEIYYTFSIS